MSNLLYSKAVTQTQPQPQPRPQQMDITQQKQLNQYLQQEQQQQHEQQQLWFNYQLQIEKQKLYQQQMQIQQWNQEQQYSYPISPTSPAFLQQYQILEVQQQQQHHQQQQPIPQPIPSKREIYLEKQSIFDTITSLNPGFAFGSYVVQNIINSNLSPEEKEPSHFKNTQRLSNHIEIMFHSSKCGQFLQNIFRAFAKGGYSLEEKHKGDITKLTEYASLILEAEIMFLSTINITVKTRDDKPYINIKVNMFIANIPEYVPLVIPYGLLTTEKSYMIMYYDAKRNLKYEMQQGIADTRECIMKIKNNITTYMPNYNYSKLSELLKSVGSSSYKIDFNLSDGKYSDFAITNISNKHTTSMPPCCSKCSTEIMSSELTQICKTPLQNPSQNPLQNPSHIKYKNYKHVITKCCARNYHFDCLFENYVEDGNFKCDHCGIVVPDTLGRNKEILMCLIGYFE